MKKILNIFILSFVIICVSACDKNTEPVEDNDIPVQEVSCLDKAKMGDFSCYTGIYETKINTSLANYDNYEITDDYFKQDVMCSDETFSINSKCPNNEFMIDEIEGMICLRKGTSYKEEKYYYGTLCIIPPGVEYRGVYPENEDGTGKLFVSSVQSTDTTKLRVFEDGIHIATYGINDFYKK